MSRRYNSPLPYFNVGNAKMRGKKYALLTCGCCDITNYRDKLNDDYTKKEINNFTKGESCTIKEEDQRIDVLVA